MSKLINRSRRGTEQIGSPELVSRSYGDLAELATAAGDEATAAQWRAAAAQAADR